MFERYREYARRAIFFSKSEARQSGSPYIEPIHLLLGFTHYADSKANQLFGLSAHVENFRAQLEIHAVAKHSTSEDFPLSNASKRVLAYTAEEAERLGSRLIGSEHLLLGLLREKRSDVPEILAKAGIVCVQPEIRSGQHRVFPSLIASRTTTLIPSPTTTNLPSNLCAHSRLSRFWL